MAKGPASTGVGDRLGSPSGAAGFFPPSFENIKTLGEGVALASWQYWQQNVNKKGQKGKNMTWEWEPPRAKI